MRYEKDYTFLKLPYALVDTSISEGWVLQLSYLVTIKKLFGNGIVYDFSYNSLASKLGISKSACYKNVKFLLEKGLVRLEGSNLVPLSSKELKSWVDQRNGAPSGNGKISIKIFKRDLKKTSWVILARVPIQSIKQQKANSEKRSEAKVIRAKVDRGDFIHRKDYSFMKAFEEKDAEKGIKTSTHEGVYLLSDKKISTLTGRSISNVRDMFSFWVKEGLIVSTIIKGRVLDTHVTQRSYEAMRVEQPNIYSKTYLNKGLVIEFNKRAVQLGSKVKGTLIVSN